MIGRSQSPSADKLLAWTTIGCASLSLLLLVVQHALRPELDPLSHVLSEYALGELGWVQQLWFVSLAIACASLVACLPSYLHGMRGWIGLLSLFAAVVGLTMAAIYPMDPPTVPIDQASHSGRLHSLAAMIGNPGFLVASLFLSLALRREQPWVGSSGLLMAAAHLFWISFVLMAGAVFAAFSQQPPAETNFIGLANRLLGAAYSIWLIVAALPMTRARQAEV